MLSFVYTGGSLCLISLVLQVFFRALGMYLSVYILELFFLYMHLFITCLVGLTAIHS